MTPSRNDPDGTPRTTGASLFSRSDSKFAKKKNLSLLTGPPIAPP
jgi:hypothetical protein